ncbi:MAG: galactose mutarotase [Cyanobium sp.]
MPLTQRDTPYRHWDFQDPVSGDRLRLVPERGGLISGWRCQGRELLYLDEARFANPALSVRGGVPVLFPICGGLPDNRLRLPEGDFNLAQHGFARDRAWRIEPLADGPGVAMELEDDALSRASYPFSFLLRLEVRLVPSALEIVATVTHRVRPGAADPSHPMPFSLGLHPYFAVTALENVSVEGLPEACFDHLTMDGARTADQLPKLGEGIDLLTRPGGAPVRLRDGGNGRVIELQTQTPWDLVVLWSEPPRPMVCLEPWSGPRQALLSGDRRLELAPGAAMELRSRFVLSAAGS